MPRDTFKRLLENLNLSDNEQLDKQDKFSKLLPMIIKSDKIFLKAYSRQRVNKKSMQKEYKI